MSFVRSLKQQRVVLLGATPQPVELDLGTTSLVVVEMQNEFLHPQGWFGAPGNEEFALG